MRLGLALRDWFRATRRTVSPEGIFSKSKPGAQASGPRATAGVNQPVLNLSWVLPTSQLDACEALWVNQSRPDFTASNNTFG